MQEGYADEEPIIDADDVHEEGFGFEPEEVIPAIEYGEDVVKERKEAENLIDEWLVDPESVDIDDVMEALLDITIRLEATYQDKYVDMDKDIKFLTDEINKLVTYQSHEEQIKQIQNKKNPNISKNFRNVSEKIPKNSREKIKIFENANICFFKKYFN